MNIRFPLSWPFALALAVAPMVVPAAAEGWKPYIEGGQGEAKDFGNPKELKDKEWLSVRYTEYSGYKTPLGVVASEEKTAYPASYKNEFARVIVALSDAPQQVPNPQNFIEDLVREALLGTNRFSLVERTTAAGDIAREHDLVDSSRVDPSTAPRAGSIRGAEYIVKVTLIELNPDKESKEITAAGGKAAANKLPAFGDLGIKNRVAFCRLNVRVIRSETGEIVSDQTVDGTAASTKLTGIVGFGLRKAGGLVAGKSKKEAPISNAMAACANKAAYYVAHRLQETAWQGSVAGLAGDQLTITGGANVGLKEGMTLTLLSVGENVVDPETGEVIGSESSDIGEIKVASVQEKSSTCELVRGGEGVKIGDRVRREVQK